MKKDPTQGMTACEGFFLLVIEAHILTVAMTFFEMKSIDGEPSQTHFPAGSSELDSLQRRNLLMLACRNIVDHFVDLSFAEQQPKQASEQKQDSEEKQDSEDEQDSELEESESEQEDNSDLEEDQQEQPSKHLEKESEDRVLSYACDILSLGLLYMEFVDGVREDGKRIIRCWRFLLLFKASHRTNYSIEAFTLLAQNDVLLPYHQYPWPGWQECFLRPTHGTFE